MGVFIRLVDIFNRNSTMRFLTVCGVAGDGLIGGGRGGGQICFRFDAE
jgi:hypothetical protein